MKSIAEDRITDAIFIFLDLSYNYKRQWQIQDFSTGYVNS